MTPSEAFHAAVSELVPLARPHGLAGAHEETVRAQHSRRIRQAEAALRREVERRDIADNLALNPPLTRSERIGFAICMAVCAFIGAMLAIGGL